MKTYNDIFFEARKTLKAGGVEAYNVEARILACKAAGKSFEHFVRDAMMYVPDGSEYEKALNELVRRRLDGEPVAYITGKWEFYGLPMAVSSDVLIPRIDTEVLVDAALELIARRPQPVRILDLCAGSGCVGIAVGSKLIGAKIVLVDKSVKALHVCRQNIFMNKMNKNAMCIDGDAMDSPPLLIGQFDMIVCNPPYIPTGDIDKLDRSVKSFEPVSALDGGEDGMDFFRAVAAKWKTVIKDGGFLAFECGIGQAEALGEILRKNGFINVRTYKDTLAIDRVVAGQAVTG